MSDVVMKGVEAAVDLSFAPRIEPFKTFIQTSYESPSIGVENVMVDPDSITL